MGTNEDIIIIAPDAQIATDQGSAICGYLCVCDIFISSFVHIRVIRG